VHKWTTFNADVAGLEISAYFARARQSAVVDGGDDYRTAATSRAQRIKLIEDVQLAAEIAVVDRQAASKTHSTEVRRLHQDHLVLARTARYELLRLAVL